MIKTITSFQIQRVDPADLKPGMILADGIVLGVREVGSLIAADVPHAVVFPSDAGTFQVYGRLGAAETKILVESWADALERTRA